MTGPVVNAGSDQTITNAQPLQLTALISPGTYQLDTTKTLWTQVSGPDCTMINVNAAISMVYELSAGTYVFQFSATDLQGNTSTDQIQVTVSSAQGGPLYIPNINPYGNQG